MRRLFILSALLIAVSLPSFAALTVRVVPRPRNVDVDGNVEMSVKHMVAGAPFVLTVCKDQDVRHFDIQWFKDGVKLEGETGQHLRYPLATADLAGVYTVSMSSPCATVMSKPMTVVVENRRFALNTEIGGNDGVAGHTNEVGVPTFTLHECSPNPVTDRTTITFETSSTSPVTLKVVDLNGNVIATLVNDVVPAGTHSVDFNTREHNMASELYYYVLSAPGFTATKPLMLVK
ncbi:MAG: T9SS type A sorting domain-containing protein [Bradyrhizobiaceae bacterium]|nr:T9SS type A sorting domain-containing protein [Bradyrhizobiaceae bacterium]